MFGVTLLVCRRRGPSVAISLPWDYRIENRGTSAPRRKECETGAPSRVASVGRLAIDGFACLMPGDGYADVTADCYGHPHESDEVVYTTVHGSPKARGARRA